jgi:hypothetical protein
MHVEPLFLVPFQRILKSLNFRLEPPLRHTRQGDPRRSSEAYSIRGRERHLFGVDQCALRRQCGQPSLFENGCLWCRFTRTAAWRAIGGHSGSRGFRSAASRVEPSVSPTHRRAGCKIGVMAPHERQTWRDISETEFHARHAPPPPHPRRNAARHDSSSGGIPTHQSTDTWKRMTADGRRERGVFP